MVLEDNINVLKGIGPKLQSLFNRLNIYTVRDLISYYPAGYSQMEPVISAASGKVGDRVALKGSLVRFDSIRRGKIILIGYFKDSEGRVFTCTWFNMPYLMKSFKKNCNYVFRGELSIRNARPALEQPEIYSEAEYKKLENRYLPNYGKTKGLTNNMIKKHINNALELMGDEILKMDFTPSYYVKKHGMTDYKSALYNIHFPESQLMLTKARERLVYNEFFMFIYLIRANKEGLNRDQGGLPMESCKVSDSLIEKLPYKLTKAQLKVYEEIKKDIASRKVVSRLIQGDVGSGKTIVSLLAILIAVENGYQAALMAPTQVLATQHFESFTSLFKEYGLNYKVALLTGALTKKQKDEAYEKIREGHIDIVIGTSAVIQDAVEFNNLGLVITDEQHRFGVNQRKNLMNKGKLPHCIVMSATPIPRTLAVILYGDMDISIIDELPANRKPVENYVVDESFRPRIYKFIEKHVKEGRQAYIICPLAVESELSEGENVVEYYDKLKSQISKDVRLDYLHGKMKPGDKDEIIAKFAKGETDVLVSTTVIEVGINVPNANIMLIENADRFGLSALHQLRGRIGRGEHQSYCIFMSSKKTKTAIERLSILKKSNDGFYIASKDMELRGFGELLGIRQSGKLNFKIGDIYTDSKLLKTVSEDIDEVFRDRTLSEDELARLDKAMIHSGLYESFAIL